MISVFTAQLLYVFKDGVHNNQRISRGIYVAFCRRVSVVAAYGFATAADCLSLLRVAKTSNGTRFLGTRGIKKDLVLETARKK